MTNVVPFKKIVNKTRIKNSIFCHFEKIYRKNNNCRVAMTTTYVSSSVAIGCLLPEIFAWYLLAARWRRLPPPVNPNGQEGLAAKLPP